MNELVPEARVLLKSAVVEVALITARDATATTSHTGIMRERGAHTVLNSMPSP
jgi:hypothetical protein